MGLEERLEPMQKSPGMREGSNPSTGTSPTEQCLKQLFDWLEAFFFCPQKRAV
jgi:hypothetical protein